MKKTSILLLTILFSVGLMAQSNQNSRQNRNAKNDESLYYKKEKKESHWSITLEGGINRFDGDIIQGYNSLIPDGKNKLTLGGSVEYTLTPVWSMGVDYYYLPLAGHANYSGGNYAEFDANMHNINYFMSFNLLKAFYKNTKTKWGLWLNAGLGYAWYKSNYFTTREGMTIKDGHGNTYIDFSDTIDDGRTFAIPVGLLAEYNISKNLAIGAKLYYRGFNRDVIEQRIQHGVTNDFLEMATLQLRWKFDAHDRNHTRNINVTEFNGEIFPPLKPQKIPNLQPKIDSLQNALNKLQPQVAQIPDLEKRIKDLESRPTPTPQIIEKTIITPPAIAGDCDKDGDSDGVPDCRDREPNTPPNTPVDYWGRSIAQYELDEAAVYFDFDKSDLDTEAHKAIRMAAEKLKADPELNVEVRGFCDFMGTAAYNEKLSQRRANNVRNELVKKYGISSSRIIANGKGRILLPPEKTRKNRRCNFFYDK
ncbi:MAG: OmpA family protein [Paludibacteraceae bacterium]